MMRRCVALLTLGASICACAGEAESGAGFSDDFDRDDFPAVEVREAARIGSLDDPLQGLTRVGPVLIGPAEEIVVGQPQERVVDVFSPEGRYLRTIGRDGEGPGEMRGVTRVGFRGDTLFVGDDDLRRLSFFTLDGRFLRSRPWSGETRSEKNGAVTTSYTPGTPELLLEEGDGLLEVPTFQYVAVMQGQGPPPPPDPRTLIPFVRTDSSGQVTDTLGWRVSVMHRLDVPRSDGRPFWFTLPFSAQRYGALLRDGGGLVTVEQDSSAFDPHMRVTRIGPTGDTVFTRRLAYDPVAPTDPLLQREAERIVDAATNREGLPSAAAVMNRLASSPLRPSRLPPVTALATGQDGSIWLRREEPDGEMALWQALDSEGEPLGSLALPRSQRIVAVRGDRLIAHGLDELDVPFLVIYELER